MPRLRHSAYAAARESDLSWALLLGPCEGDGFSDEDLRVGWDVFGDALMQERHAAGSRPWGWWEFEACEPRLNPGGTGPLAGLRMRMSRRSGWRNSAS